LDELKQNFVRLLLFYLTFIGNCVAGEILHILPVVLGLVGVILAKIFKDLVAESLDCDEFLLVLSSLIGLGTRLFDVLKAR